MQDYKIEKLPGLLKVNPAFGSWLFHIFQHAISIKTKSQAHLRNQIEQADGKNSAKRIPAEILN